MQLSRDPELWKHLVFVEDYDMKVARELVQGVDLWLNNPRRGEEACGTSGMKAAINGVLNLSILDGWFDEAYEKMMAQQLIGEHETMNKIAVLGALTLYLDFINLFLFLLEFYGKKEKTKLFLKGICSEKL